MNEVWIIAEQRLGRLMNVSLELLSKGTDLARKLDVKLASVLLGEQIQSLAEQLVYYGADKVYLEEDPRLRLYQSELYAHLIAKLIETEQPQIVLVGATGIGQDLASRVAAKLRTGLTAHCVDVCIDEWRGKPLLIAVVPGWGGNLMVRIACPDRRPQMATVNPGTIASLPPDKSRRGEIIRLKNDMSLELHVETLEMVEEEPSHTTTLDDADVVVAGGWGLSSVGNFGPVEELAEVLGGAVGGTRPAVDNGWISEDNMIGQSGKIVSPKLFISVGASGAPQFTSGFTRSKVILAVDQNPNAPIFDVADVGLVGDLRDVLPCLIAEIKASQKHA